MRSRKQISFKGTELRNFSPPFFIIKQLLLVPIDTFRIDLEFFLIFLDTEKSRLPAGEYTGESTINTSTSTNIRKNSKTFQGMSNEAKRSCLMKKPEAKNSYCNTPFGGLYWFETMHRPLSVQYRTLMKK